MSLSSKKNGKHEHVPAARMRTSAAVVSVEIRAQMISWSITQSTAKMQKKKKKAIVLFDQILGFVTFLCFISLWSEYLWVGYWLNIVLSDISHYFLTSYRLNNSWK